MGRRRGGERVCVCVRAGAGVVLSTLSLPLFLILCVLIWARAKTETPINSDLHLKRYGKMYALWSIFHFFPCALLDAQTGPRFCHAP